MNASKISQIGEMGPVGSPIFEFGQFRLDPQNRLLLRADGKAIPLTPKAFDALLFLVERSGQLVTKDQLMAAVWPDTFVSEANLTQTIFMLRKALGESASEQRYILTVPGSGYRFVTAAQGFAGRGEGATLMAINQRRVPGRWVWLLLAAAILLLAAGTYEVVAPLPTARVRRVALMPATNHANPWQHLITDGARVYFLEQDGDRSILTQASVAGGESRPVITPFPAVKVFDISRDHATFLLGDGSRDRQVMPLWLWEADTAAATRVGDIVAEDASWHVNGRDILYARDHDIRMVARDGSGDRLFLHTQGDPRFMRWSPDGTRLRFSVYGGTRDEVRIWEVNGDGKGVHILGLSTERGECCGEWTPDGRYYLYTVFMPSVENLWAVRDRGAGIHWGAKQPVQLTSGPTSVYDGLPVSNDRIFTYVEATAYEAARFDFKTHELIPFFPGKQLLSLSFSSDGQQATYQLFPDSSLWRSKVDGSDAVEIVTPPARAARPQWSPDAKMIAFETYVHGKGMRAYTIKAEGGAPRPVLERDVQQSLPYWSPDSKSVAVAVNVLVPEAPATDRGIFIVDPATHAATRLEGSEGLTSPVWSPDGGYLIARTPDDHDILQWDSNKKSWTKFVSGRQLAGPLWSNDSKYLYYQDVLEPGQPIYRLQMSDLKREKIYSFERELAGGVRKALILAVAPDGSLIMSLMRSGVKVHAMDLELP